MWAHCLIACRHRWTQLLLAVAVDGSDGELLLPAGPVRSQRASGTVRHTLTDFSVFGGISAVRAVLPWPQPPRTASASPLSLPSNGRGALNGRWTRGPCGRGRAGNGGIGPAIPRVDVRALRSGPRHVRQVRMGQHRSDPITVTIGGDPDDLIGGSIATARSENPDPPPPCSPF